MALTMQDLKDRLRAILLLEGNIKIAKTASLWDIGASLPAAFVSTADATYEKIANDLQQITRNMLLTIVVKPVEEGYELEAENDTDVFFDSISELFQARPSLNTVDNSDPLPNVQTAQLLSDTGFVLEEIAGVQYAMVVFTLQVTYMLELVEGA